VFFKANKLYFESPNETTLGVRALGLRRTEVQADDEGQFVRIRAYPMHVLLTLLSKAGAQWNH
jgi:hypothetical protein